MKLLSSAALILSALMVGAVPLTRDYYPLPNAAGFRGVDYVNDRYFMAHLFSEPEFYVSSDGEDWETVCAPGSVIDFAYGNGLYVAVGRNGLILTSPDAETWTVATSNTAEHLTNIIFDGTKFYIAGGETLVRGDGVTWTPFDLGLPITFYGVGYDGVHWVAVGNEGNLWYSTNETDWTLEIFHPQQGNYLISKIIAHEGSWIFSTSDGPFTGSIGGPWTLDTNVRTPNDYALKGDDLLAVSDNRLYMRDSLGQWTQGTLPSNALSLFGIASNGTDIVISGDSAFIGTGTDINNIDFVYPPLTPIGGLITDGTTVVSFGSNVRTGTSLIEWTQTEGSHCTFGYWDGSRFILYTDSGTVLTSTDGYTWSSTPTAFNGLIKDMHFDGNIYVAVGDFGVASGTEPENLTIRSITVQAGKKGGIFAMTHLAHNGTSFFAAGRESALTVISTDGITWNAHEQTGDFDNITNLYYIQGKFMNWDPGYMYSSDNAIDWVLEYKHSDFHSRTWCCEHGCLGGPVTGGGDINLQYSVDSGTAAGLNVFSTDSFVCMDRGHFLIGYKTMDQIWEVRFPLEYRYHEWPETSLLTWIEELVRFAECPDPD